MNSDIRFDEVERGDRPLVAIGRGGYVPPHCIVFVIPVWIIVIILFAHDVRQMAVPFGTASSLMLAMLPALWFARAPRFAVYKEGIKVPFPYRSSDRSVWDPLCYGFVEWKNVRWCRWSRYDVGLLSIQIESIRVHSRRVPLLGTTFTIELPSRLIQYRVREAYRKRVESAIRAVGKWGE